MAASGRDLLIKKDNTAIIGARTDSVTINNEPVDITSKSSAGFRELLDEPGTRSIDLSISGVWHSTNVLQAPALAGTYELTDITVDIGSTTISGDFMLVDFEVSGDHDDAIEFSASLQSSGAFTTS